MRFKKKTKKRKHGGGRNNTKTCSKGGLAYFLCDNIVQRPWPGYKCVKKCVSGDKCYWILKPDDKMAW